MWRSPKKGWRKRSKRVQGWRVSVRCQGGGAARPPGAASSSTATAGQRTRARFSAGRFRVTLADGRLVQGAVSPAHPVFTVPPRPLALDVVRDYVRLGVAHILAGPDHLLFVFGLVLLAGTARRLLVTVSAFTLGHSITLTLAALGIVDFPTRVI